MLDQQVKFPAAEPVFAEQTFSAHLLRENKYKDADKRIEALGKLPEIISGASNDKQLCVNIVRLLLFLGVPEASFVAILKLRGAEDGGEDETLTNTDAEKTLPDETRVDLSFDADLEVLHWDCRRMVRQDFSPSARLMRTATETGESVLHVWSRTANANPNFTQSENVDWAFCTPVLSDSCPGWAIYVSGEFAASTMVQIDSGMNAAEALQDDLKFTELTATTLGALRQVRALQRRQDSPSQLLCPRGDGRFGLAVILIKYLRLGRRTFRYCFVTCGVFRNAAKTQQTGCWSC